MFPQARSSSASFREKLIRRAAPIALEEPPANLLHRHQRISDGQAVRRRDQLCIELLENQLVQTIQVRLHVDELRPVEGRLREAPDTERDVERRNLLREVTAGAVLVVV